MLQIMLIGLKNNKNTHRRLGRIRIEKTELSYLPVFEGIHEGMIGGVFYRSNPGRTILCVFTDEFRLESCSWSNWSLLKHARC